MYAFKSIAVLLVAAIPVIRGLSATVVDRYAVTIRLHVPQVLNNTESLGYRIFRVQTIKCKMSITYAEGKDPAFSFDEAVNNSFRVGGSKVTYTVTTEDDIMPARLSYIGKNGAESFKVKSATVVFFVEAVPSYAKGDPGEDNSFHLMFSGRGYPSADVRSGAYLPRMFRGYVTGTQGCSCYAYGHTSPTRTAGVNGATSEVTDVAAAFGTWTARFESSQTID